MAEQTIHEAVWAWLTTCPHIRDLYFNYAAEVSGATVLTPLTAYRDAPVKEFTSQASERQYDFALVRFAPLSDAPNSGENIDVLVDAEKLAAWVEAQDAAGNYPVLPAGCTVTAVTVAPPGQSYFAARSENEAKYQFQFAVRYLYRREEA